MGLGMRAEQQRYKGAVRESVIAVLIFAAMIGLIAAVVYAEHYAPCDMFSGQSIRNVPARCLRHYGLPMVAP